VLRFLFEEIDRDFCALIFQFKTIFCLFLEEFLQIYFRDINSTKILYALKSLHSFVSNTKKIKLIKINF
jgi:hypothetical protein